MAKPARYPAPMSNFIYGSLALLAWAATAHAQAPVADTLEQRVTACAACHGARGEGVRANEYYPAIAGKPAGYLFNQLRNFRERRRQSPVMTHMVAVLSDEYLREIAGYYARLAPSPSPRRPAPPGADLARGEALVMHGDPSRNVPACASCHGKALTGMEAAIPGLLGLDPQYVAAQMGAWRSKLRRAQEPDCMATIAARLQPGDIPAITAWLASRAVPGRPAPLPAGSHETPIECGGIDAR
jgi:cytochrome c553